MHLFVRLATKGPVCHLVTIVHVIIDLFISGLNTIYVDEEINAGDTVVVDMAYPDEIKEWKLDECDRTGSSPTKPWGFVSMKNKKGTPRSKITLVIRQMPNPEAGQSPEVQRAMRKLRRGFELRGQIVGKCTQGAKRGERCDLVLAGNCIGVSTYSQKEDEA